MGCLWAKKTGENIFKNQYIVYYFQNMSSFFVWSMYFLNCCFKKMGWVTLIPFCFQVDEFLQALINYDKEHIPENCLKVVKERYLKDPEFNPSLVLTKSFAAAGLSAWVINIVKFYEVLHIVCSSSSIKLACWCVYLVVYI